MEYRVVEKRPQSLIGTFANGRFHVVRLLRDWGSIRPRIDGTLSRTVNGCQVDVRLKTPALAIAARAPFMLLGVLFVLFVGGLFALWGVIVLLAPVFMSHHEAQKAEQLLAALFQTAPRPSRARAVASPLPPA